MKLNKQMNPDNLIAIDLFAGCGGLSLGLRKAGFRITAAVEIDKAAAETYKKNHQKTKVITRDIRKVKAKELLDKNGKKPVVIAGCAPCQGFCSLTREYKANDPRNGLVLDMARIIRKLKPDAIMMENVPGLATKGKEIFESFLTKIRAMGYQPNWQVVQMANYGIPQSRRRLVMVAGKGFVIPFPEQTHAKKPKPKSRLKPWVTLRNIIKTSPAPVTLGESLKSKRPQKYNWHIVRNLLPKTKAKLRGAVPGQSWFELDEELRPECHRGNYRGFSNVYGRMSWDNVAVTMTAGCTTASKGRFGHPDRRRYTISVREAARIQTFPNSYKFITDEMDTVCEMVGNAVPPAFAYIMGKKIRESLESHYEAMARKCS